LLPEGAPAFEYPAGTPHPSCKVGDILQPEGEVNEKYTLKDGTWEYLKLHKERARAKGNGFGYTTFTADSPHTNTISARYYKDGSEALIDREDGRNPRKLTPRECARLQGFPDDFVIPVSDARAYKQFGNSVCIPMIEAVAKAELGYMREQGLL
jgi:DNA (cytosine-5)-methyltransferase 1